MYFLKSKKGVSLKKYWFGIPEKNKDIDSGYIEHISISEKKKGTVKKFTSYYI